MRRGPALNGRRVLVLAALLAGTSVAGAVVAVTLGASAARPAAAPPMRVGTATVRVTNLATSVLTGGTLGYGSSRPVVNQLAGTYTSLPGVGSTIRAGQVLYRVDNQPVIAMTGRIPAWRAFTPGMTAGPDVTELQSSLIALGYARGLVAAPAGQFDQLTESAVLRWQESAGDPVTGQIALGDIVFLPSPIRVSSLSVAAGQNAVPGAIPYQASTVSRMVIVPLSPDLPQVSIGEPVSIVLPSGAGTPGTVTGIGPAPLTPGAGPSGSNSGSSSSQPGSSTVLTVRPDLPGATGTGDGIAVQVTLTVQSVRHVLAVPVAALLALAGGGYGLEIVTPSGAHRLVAATTGIFAGGLVQVSGSQITAGTKVVVAQ
jgi:peptidoglycan hydrolase-like protein with peptidoglycan-binding domain